MTNQHGMWMFSGIHCVSELTTSYYSPKSSNHPSFLTVFLFMNPLIKLPAIAVIHLESLFFPFSVTVLLLWHCHLYVLRFTKKPKNLTYFPYISTESACSTIYSSSEFNLNSKISFPLPVPQKSTMFLPRSTLITRRLNKNMWF